MMTRRAFDFYESPAWFIESLLDAEPVHGSVLEPCSGDQAIVRALSSARLAVLTNDINPRRQADHHLDANDGVSWQSFPPVDWVITNPPFSTAFSMLQHAYGHARIGVALYLRISFLEPTLARGPWLEMHPLTRLIVLPRHSFSGDGKTDSVTGAWMVWRHDVPASTAIQIRSKQTVGLDSSRCSRKTTEPADGSTLATTY